MFMFSFYLRGKRIQLPWSLAQLGHVVGSSLCLSCWRKRQRGVLIAASQFHLVCRGLPPTNLLHIFGPPSVQYSFCWSLLVGARFPDWLEDLDSWTGVWLVKQADHFSWWYQSDTPSFGLEEHCLGFAAQDREMQTPFGTALDHSSSCVVRLRGVPG